MGPIWGRQDPGGPYVGPMNFAICYLDLLTKLKTLKCPYHTEKQNGLNIMLYVLFWWHSVFETCAMGFELLMSTLSVFVSYEYNCICVVSCVTSCCKINYKTSSFALCCGLNDTLIHHVFNKGVLQQSLGWGLLKLRSLISPLRDIMI